MFLFIIIINNTRFCDVDILRWFFLSFLEFVPYLRCQKLPKLPYMAALVLSDMLPILIITATSFYSLPIRTLQHSILKWLQQQPNHKKDSEIF